MRALISVYDKSGLDEFARGLVELGWQLVASGRHGRARSRRSASPSSTSTTLTNSPEMLGGRVKTLHPRVHAGILARRDRRGRHGALAEHGIEPFDLVCVNLYPFADVAGRKGVTEDEAVEMIDIGGPSMLRARGEELRPRRTGLPRRPVRPASSTSCASTARSRSRRAGALAAEAFAAHGGLRGRDRELVQRPRGLPRFARRSRSRRYRTSATARTRTSAARTTPRRGRRRHLLSRVEQLHGPELSFNNLNDLSGARRLALEFALPACVIVKHANPCGVAVGSDARGGLREGARMRPDLGLRRRRRPEPRAAGARRRAARRAPPTSSSRPGTPRKRSPRLRERRKTSACSSTGSGAAPNRASGATSACSAGCSSRMPTPRSRIARAGRS